MHDTPIAEVPFTGGTTRPVWIDADQRQYVEDDGGERVYGVWLKPPVEDEPLPPLIVVSDRSHQRWAG